jgi:hypothetical protein
MAGGWDGDALAGQMEDALERQQAAAEARANRNNSTPEDRAHALQLETIRLSKARLREQLSRATNPTYRATLERALQSLESQAEE